MFSEITMLKDLLLPEDYPKGEETDKYYRIQTDIINTLSKNQFTISQTRQMFNNILRQFERDMPVTNHSK